MEIHQNSKKLKVSLGEIKLDIVIPIDDIVEIIENPPETRFCFEAVFYHEEKYFLAGGIELPDVKNSEPFHSDSPKRILLCLQRQRERWD